MMAMLIGSTCTLGACTAKIPPTVTLWEDTTPIAVMPFKAIPDWGSMTQPSQWDRTWDEYSPDELIPVPEYDLEVLTYPLKYLWRNRTKENNAVIGAKQFYSTRFYGAYNLDSKEDVNPDHPAIDLKMPFGAPVGSVTTGQIIAVEENDLIGRYLIQEVAVDYDVFRIIYGHCTKILVDVGQVVEQGQPVCTVGLTGKTSAPHLHLEIQHVNSGQPVHPIEFLKQL